MMRPLLRLVIILASFVTAGCMRHVQEQVQVDIPQKLITFTGKIDRTSLGQFKSALAKQPNVRFAAISITSEGGDALSAIELGFIIHDLSLDVIVPRLCISACSEYVLVAGRRRLVGNGAIVLFHGSPKLLHDEYLVSGYPEAAKLFDLGLVQARTLYAAAGVNPAFLDFARLGLGPRCLLVDESASRTDAASFQIATQYEEYGLSKQIMDDANYKVIGYWPTGISAILSDLQKRGFNRPPPLGFVVETPGVNNLGALAAIKAVKLPPCGR